MADNSTQSGADTIATDDVTTLNGGASSGVKVQRFKNGYGDDGTYRDVSKTYPLPTGTTVQATGTFSASDAVVAAPDGTGTIVSGASTAGSVVALAVPDGMASWTLLLKSYGTGTVYSEASSNSTNGTDGDWIPIKGRRTGTTAGTEVVVYAYTANGYYRGNDAGFTYFRARLIGTGTPTVQLTASSGTGAVFLNSSIPSGGNSIGTVAVTSAPTATVTTVAATTTSTTLIAANTARRGVTLHATTGSATVYVRLGGGTASSAAGGHSFDMSAGSYYEVPYGFTGAITAVWASAAGAVNITELT